jgi:hypothetical protein
MAVRQCRGSRQAADASGTGPSAAPRALKIPPKQHAGLVNFYARRSPFLNPAKKRGDCDSPDSPWHWSQAVDVLIAGSASGDD